MADTSLGTTNLFLGIMAAVSVLEAVAFAAVAVAAWKAYGRSLEALAEARQQIAPLVARVNVLADKIDGIAGDVKDATAVARKALHFYGLARGIRAAYRSFVGRHEHRRHEEG